MKKNTIIIALFVISIGLISFDVVDILSTGAPIGSTGAPNENTCAKSGCHTGTTLNSEGGVLSIDFNNGILEYEPGKTYDITVSMSQSDLVRFGFEAVIVKDLDQLKAGELIVTDNTRMQIIPGVNQFVGKDYITYKYAGTAAISTGLGEWSFQWKAPDIDEGSVTIYVGSVAANNDATDGGDLVYTKQITIQPKATEVKTVVANVIDINIFPNPVKENLNVSYSLNTSALVTMTLMDIQGKNTEVLFFGNQAAGENKKSFPVSSSYAKGSYLLLIDADGKQTIEKISIE